ncbi:MAG: cytochrome c biogenesis protein ResB [Actinocatenispora sp.]
MATTDSRTADQQVLEQAGREDPNALSSRPDPGAPRRIGGNGALATARRWWRQLTSMRTALLLLFLLAVAAAPGSLLPQHNLNEEKVTTYFQQHPTLAPTMDKIGLFGVYSSPWFAAIYLLLFISLIGCLTPRIRLHVRAMRRQPPDAPRQLDRLREHDRFTLDESAPEAAERVRLMLRGRRFRSVLRRHDDGTATVSAEKGFLRETGNLLFHFSLVALLVGVAIGAGFGWHGGRLLMPGRDNAFCDSLQQFDQHSLGSRVSGSDLPPFCVTLDKFNSAYQPNAEPRTLAGDISYTTAAGGAARPYRLEVNHPLRIDDVSVYLVGHGYAPVIRYTDRYGHSQTTMSPFLPTDTNMTSDGVALFPDANVDPHTGRRDVDLQMAFQGVFFPTVAHQGGQGSTFPAPRDPALLLFAYRGNTGTDAGIPHSVYTLDQDQIDNGQLKQVGTKPKLLRPGQHWTLDDGTTVDFVGVRQWATIQVRHDPGERVVLVAGIALLLGLLGSLTLRRRRVWFRFTPDGSGSTVTAGGLARTEYVGFHAEFDGLVAAAARGKPGEGATRDRSDGSVAGPAGERPDEPDPARDRSGDDEPPARGDTADAPARGRD